VVASSVFIIEWKSSRFIDNGYFLVLGVSLFFVATLDLLHTLSCEGMGIFKEYTAKLLN